MVRGTLLLSCGPSLAVSLVLVFKASAQPTIANASFEADAAPPYPGYGAISSWTPGGTIDTGFGMNEAGGAFADNGTIPHGTRVAFMQNNGTLSQTVAGFNTGDQYWLAYRENARGLCCGERVATLSVVAGGLTVVPEHVVAIVGGANPYQLVTSDVFTAAQTDMTVSFVKGGTGDSTALLDDVRIFTRDSLRLGIVMQSGTMPAIRIEGIPNRRVTLEFVGSLTPGTTWQLLTNFVLNSESTELVDSTAPASGPRFYRAQQLP